MTKRLIGLITLILLSSLVASWVLLDHYQERLMERVAHTITSVGEATLRTVEMTQPPAPRLRPRQLVVVDAPDGRTVIDLEGATIVSDSAAADGGEGPLLISPSRVYTQRDAEGGLVLRIPTYDSKVQDTGADAVSEEAVGDFVLPVPTGDYATLFDDMRQKSLLVFSGVFLVALVLASIIATRFTRPIRELDTGLHRLSAGDFDAEVTVPGSDEVARLGTVFNDMTRKLRESRAREREMARRDRLSSLGRLAAGVAHDVRNPLHSMGLTLSHLRKNARPNEAAQAQEFDRSLELLGVELQRLDRLVENFMRFARRDRPALVAVDLRELVRETAQLVEKDAARRSIDLQLEFEDDVPSLSLHPDSMRSAILNLVLNSFEAMPEGGRLVISVGSQGPEVVVRVTDSGRGIAAEDQDKVFDFGHTDRAEGSGLGLAMVHHVVVEEHDGRIDLESEPGRGTTVSIHLPDTSRESDEGGASA